ncbi:MAG: hypothetical protein KA385_02710 [Vicinamibacteria bacterium]|nr:hypothetical protein [Vicinamibacteria bacterium]
MGEAYSPRGLLTSRKVTSGGVISPDIAAAVSRLAREGVLAPEQARLFGRVARGDLVTLSKAIHGLLYLGVAALTAGVGLLFRDEIANLGPITLALAVGLAAGLCLTFVARKSPPFTKAAVDAPHFAFDYVLVLGALLAAADLGFIETRFSPLGQQWAYHLLLVSLAYSALALRFDSRTLFGLGLTSFAAWRGVAATSVERAIFGFFDDTSVIRLNALGCGLLFIFVGRLMERHGLKVHFEPTATHLGWLLVLQSIAWGIADGPSAALHRLALVAVGGGLAWFSWRGARFALFVFGVLAAYLGLIVIMADAVDDATGILFLSSLSAIAVIFALASVHRRFPKEAEE